MKMLVVMRNFYKTSTFSGAVSYYKINRLTDKVTDKSNFSVDRKDRSNAGKAI
jgi:hypothetical protein